MSRKQLQGLALLAALAALAGAVLFPPTILLAQERQPSLVVTLRDERGAGIAGARVAVRDADGRRELAEITTGADGRAAFETLGASRVRVAVAGALPNGLRLYQPGEDAAGVLVMALPAVLDLRVELDGLVLPDPATMVIPEYGAAIDGALAGVPEAPAAATATGGAIVHGPRPDTQSPVASQPASARPVWAVFAAIGLLVLAIAAVWAAQARGGL